MQEMIEKTRFDASSYWLEWSELSYLGCASWIVDGPRYQNSSPPINNNGFVIISHRGCDTTNPQGKQQQQQGMKFSPHQTVHHNS